MVRKLLIDWYWFGRNSFWVNFDQAVRSVAELLIIVILARLLSQEVFGQYQLLLSIFMIASLATLSGFNGALLRGLARGYDGTLAVIMNESWRWALSGIVILALTGVIWMASGNTTLGMGLLLAAPVLPFFHAYRRWQVILHAKEEFRKRAIYGLVSSLFLLVSVLIIASFLPEQLAIIFLSYIGVTAIWNVMLYRRALLLLRNNKVEKGWRASGYKLVLSEIFGTFYAHLDKLVLVFWLGVEKLAVYAVAILIGEGLKLVIGNLVGVYLPRIHRSDTKQFLKSLWSRIVPMCFLLLGIMFVTWLLVPFGLEVIFDDRYREASRIARWYLLILPGHFLATVFGYLLIKEHREWSLASAFVGSGVVNVLLYMVLIPVIGIMGAVIGSVAYYVVLAGIMAGQLWRLRESI